MSECDFCVHLPEDGPRAWECPECGRSHPWPTVATATEPTRPVLEWRALQGKRVGDLGDDFVLTLYPHGSWEIECVPVVECDDELACERAARRILREALAKLEGR